MVVIKIVIVKWVLTEKFLRIFKAKEKAPARAEAHSGGKAKEFFNF